MYKVMVLATQYCCLFYRFILKKSLHLPKSFLMAVSDLLLWRKVHVSNFYVSDSLLNHICVCQKHFHGNCSANLLTSCLCGTEPILLL